MLSVFKLEAPKLEELMKQKDIPHPAVADPKDEIASKFSGDHGMTFLIGRDGKIKQNATASLVYVAGPTMALSFTAETMRGFDEALKRELAVNP